VEPYRNAAAAFGLEKFGKLQDACGKFLKAPSIDFFHEKEFDLSSLKEKKDFRLIILSAKPEKGKEDVVGSKLLKQFEHIRKTLEKNEFRIYESGWHWNEKDDAVYWFYLDKKDLPELKKQIGPPANIKQEFIDRFKGRWKRFRVRLEKGRWVAEYPRLFRKPEQLIESIIKEDRLKIRILKM
jgi:tRNA nucleotidyltransferase (CCA-adding enzyme)